MRLQPVRFPYFDLRRASVSIGGRKLREARDFQVLSYSGAGRANGRLRRLSTGCEAEEYSGLAAGDVPLVSRGVCFFREKALVAQRAGASALVVIDDVAHAARRAERDACRARHPHPGRARVGHARARRRRRARGRGRVVGAPRDPQRDRRDAGRRRRARGDGRRAPRLGRGGPGINDNGSGAATLIEAAEAIGPDPPGARVRLAFWGAEELGLLGSRHYVRSLDRAERRRISAYLNFDMVGSPNAVPELYADGDAELGRVLRRAAGRPLGAVEVGGASDHAPFVAAGVPVNGLYTGATSAAPADARATPATTWPATPSSA